jgi:Holliday junction resolvasome RuvABC DNA-binding subunit
MTKEELINQFESNYPTLTKQANNKIITLEQDEYKATLDSWAVATLAKEAAKLEAEQSRATKISAYQKLGLTEAEIEALLPTPLVDELNA